MRQIVIILILLISIRVHAQDDPGFSGNPVTMMGTLLNLNTTNGSARYVGTGGVISTVGGDISNLMTNPAGLGMFSRTELQFTPNIQINNVNASIRHIEGERITSIVDNDKNQLKFTLNNIGGVFATRRKEGSTLRASNIAIGINRTHNFNRNISVRTVNNNKLSYAKSIANKLNNAYHNPNRDIPFPLNSSEVVSADYDDYGYREIITIEGDLVRYNSSSDIVESPVTGIVNQSGYKKIRGGVNELAIAWSGNIKDKYYIGAAMGIPFLNYTSEFEFKEEGVSGNSAFDPIEGNFQRYIMSEYDDFSGVGINLKLGGMVKLTDALKASAYIHTPTYYEITNELQTGIEVDFANSDIPFVESPLLTDDFQFVTPFKFGAGLSYLIKKRGFIGAEYEFANVSSTLLIHDNIEFEQDVNYALDNNRTGRHTFRVGGEAVIGLGRLRAGYNLSTTPFTEGIISQDGDLMSQSLFLGAGIRGKQVSLDVAFSRNQYRDYNTFYETGNNSEVGIASWNTQNQVSFTLNYRFE